LISVSFRPGHPTTPFGVPPSVAAPCSTTLLPKNREFPPADPGGTGRLHLLFSWFSSSFCDALGCCVRFIRKGFKPFGMNSDPSGRFPQEKGVESDLTGFKKRCPTRCRLLTGETVPVQAILNIPPRRCGSTWTYAATGKRNWKPNWLPNGLGSSPIATGSLPCAWSPNADRFPRGRLPNGPSEAVAGDRDVASLGSGPGSNPTRLGPGLSVTRKW